MLKVYSAVAALTIVFTLSQAAIGGCYQPTSSCGGGTTCTQKTNLGQGGVAPTFVSSSTGVAQDDGAQCGEDLFLNACGNKITTRNCPT